MISLAFLGAVLAAPLAGPLLYRWLHERPDAVRLVDGFVYFAVPALVGLQVLPAAWEHRSLAVVAGLAVGVLVPTLLERLSHALHHHTDSVALVLGLAGFLLHTLLEGAALVPGEDGVPVAFALAVILHQVPVGLVVWWLLRPRYGAPVASAGVASIAVGTLIGYALGVEVLGGLQGEAGAAFQALVSGSLVHVVFHQGRHDHAHGHHADHGGGGV